MGVTFRFRSDAGANRWVIGHQNKTSYHALQEYHALFLEYNALFVEYHALFREYHALFVEYHALFLEYHALFVEYRALFLEYNAFFVEYYALFLEDHALFVEYHALFLEYHALFVEYHVQATNTSAVATRCYEDLKAMFSNVIYRFSTSIIVVFFIKRFKYSKLQDHGSNQYFLYNIMVQTHKMEIMNIGTGNTYINV